MVPRNPLPFRLAATLHQRCHAVPKQIRALGYVDDVEDDPLVRFHVVDGEIEPHTKARVARVGANEEIVLELRDKVDSAQVPRLERGVEADVPFLRLPAVTRWSHYHLVHIPSSTLYVAVFALCNNFELVKVC